MRATLTASAIIVVLVGLALLASLAPALAHTVLLESHPDDGAELDTAPDEVVLRFNEPVSEPRVTVVGPDGEEVVDGAAVVDGEDVTQPLGELDEPGEHTIAYRVVSDDGHPVDGELTFILELAAEPTPTSTPVEDEPSPTPAPTPTPTPTPTPAVDDEPTADDEADPAGGVPWTLAGAAAAIAALAAAGVGMLRRPTL